MSIMHRILGIVIVGITLLSLVTQKTIGSGSCGLMAVGQTMQSHDVTDITQYFNYIFIIVLLVFGLFLLFGKPPRVGYLLAYSTSLLFYWCLLIVFEQYSHYIISGPNELEFNIGLSMTLFGHSPLYKTGVFVWAPAVLYFLSSRAITR